MKTVMSITVDAQALQELSASRHPDSVAEAIKAAWLRKGAGEEPYRVYVHVEKRYESREA